MANTTVDAYGRPISRHDDVPATGAWQTDPEVQRLLQILKRYENDPSNYAAGRGTQGQTHSKEWMAAQAALSRYVNQNRQRLGIPDNYLPATNNQLYDPNQNVIRNTAIATGALAGGAAAPALTGWGSGGAGGGGLAADGTIPASFSSPAGATVPTAVEGGMTAGGGVPLGGMAPAASGGVMSKLKDFITDPRNIAGLATTIPALTQASQKPATPLDDPTVQQLLQMALKRQQRTDPLHDSVTQLAMAMMPTSYQRK